MCVLIPWQFRSAVAFTMLAFVIPDDCLQIIMASTTQNDALVGDMLTKLILAWIHMMC
jgi:hypothetical protein